MVTQVRHPIWLPAMQSPGAKTFATLYAVESFARASITSVIPIQAYHLLKSEQTVSILYTVVALLGLSVTLFMPALIQRFSRRWVYTAGAASLALGSVLFLASRCRARSAACCCASWGRARWRSRSTSTSWTTSARRT